MLKEIVTRLGEQIAKNHFLSEKNIYSLVKEGRTPFRMGYVTSGNNPEWMAQYVIPPKNYDPGEIENEGVDCGGAYRYFYKDGTNKVAQTIELTSKEAEKLEELLKKILSG